MKGLFTRLVDKNIQTEHFFTPKDVSFCSDLFFSFRKDKKAVWGLFLLSFLLLFTLIGSYIHPFTYFDISLEIKNMAPSWEHWFGTDELGRDVFARTCLGTRLSLTIGVCAAIIDLFIGVIWGMLSALMGKKVDEIMMRTCDILSSLPYLLVVILLMVVMGPGMLTILISLTFTGWINMARVVRAQVYYLMKKEYVLAAQVMGASKWRIITKHLLPNSLGPILATTTMTIPMAIYTESFLSFLGLGIQAPVASLGVMVNDSIGALRYFPWRLFFPAIMIFFMMLGFNLLGDGMQKTLDPRMRK